MARGDLLDPRFVKVMRHPLRLRALVVFTDRGEASPKQVAAELGEPLDVVSYHTRVLRDAGCIQLVRTEPRRGAVEHFYKAVVQPFLDDEDWAQLPVGLRRQLSGQTIGQILQAASDAVHGNGFDRPGAHVVRMPLRLDDEAWWKLAEVVQRFLDDVTELQSRSDARRTAEDPREGLAPSELSVLHYEVTPTAPEPGGRGSGARRRSRRA